MAGHLKTALCPDGAVVPYPPHLVVRNKHAYYPIDGKPQVGRYCACMVCGEINTRTKSRNGDARFIRKHRRCGLSRGAQQRTES